MEKKTNFIWSLLEGITQNPSLLLGLKVLIVILFTFVTYLVVSRGLKILERIAREKTKWQFDELLLRSARKPIIRIVLLVGANLFFGLFSPFLGSGYAKYVEGIFYLLIVLQVTLLLMRTISLAANVYIQKYLDSRMIGGKEEFFPLVVRITKIVIFFIALIIVLKHFNQDVQSLVVSLGVGSLAVALAAQETLSNMIAGFVIMTDRPFRIGDRIQLSSGERGDVYEIGLRSTKLMTFDNTLVIVPNAEIVKEKVLNLTYPDPRTRVKIILGVAYGTDLQQVKDILISICNDNPNVLEDPPPAAYFLEFGESSLDFQLTCYVPDWRLQWPTAEEIRLEIDRRFKEAGIEVPFPQRTLWFSGNPPDEMKESKANKNPASENPDGGI